VPLDPPLALKSIKINHRDYYVSMFKEVETQEVVPEIFYCERCWL